MVKEIVCDIFDAPVDVIVHQANCFHTMGSGIARAIREKFPEAYDADCTQTEKGDRKKLGTCSVATLEKPTTRIKYVFNMYSQFTFGTEKRQTHYEAFYRGLEWVRNRVANTNLVIGIPFKIGSKLGGADWNVIKSMIYSVFQESPREVIICQKPGDE